MVIQIYLPVQTQILRTCLCSEKVVQNLCAGQYQEVPEYLCETCAGTSKNMQRSPCPVWLDDRGAGQWKCLEEVPRRTSRVPLASSYLCLFHRVGNKERFRLPGAGGEHFHCTVDPSPGHIRCRKIVQILRRVLLHNSRRTFTDGLRERVCTNLAHPTKLKLFNKTKLHRQRNSSPGWDPSLGPCQTPP